MEKYMLKQIFREIARSELSELPGEDEISWVLSESFQNRMMQLHKSQKNSLWAYTNTFQKRIAIALITIILAFSIMISVEAMRTSVKNFVVEVYEQFTRVIYNQDDNEDCDSIHDVYIAVQLPDGYEEDSSIITDNYVQTIWKHEGNELTLTQIPASGSEITFDSENSEVTQVLIHNNIGYVVRRFGQVLLIWSEHGYSFAIDCTESLGDREMIGIAENLQIK